MKNKQTEAGWQAAAADLKTATPEQVRLVAKSPTYRNAFTIGYRAAFRMAAEVRRLPGRPSPLAGRADRYTAAAA